MALMLFLRLSRPAPILGNFETVVGEADGDDTLLGELSDCENRLGLLLFRYEALFVLS